MKCVELLTVESTYWIKKDATQMLILHPPFCVPDGWKERSWHKRTEKVGVLRPDGHEMEATAQINMTHLSIRGPLTPEGCWRITLWLTDRTSEEVPIGSKILVAQAVRDAILPQLAS